MKVFIWEYANGATHNYHDGAGVVVFAETVVEARERRKSIVKADSDVFVEDPQVFDLSEEIPEDKRVFIFEDAGCC